MTNQQDSTETLEPAATQQVANLETLKLLSDGLRTRIIDLVRAQPRTVKELAEMLNLSPKKLYYHINLLEEHQLIRIVSTRIVSGIIEKTYRATAYLFLFDHLPFKSSQADAAQQQTEATIALFNTTRNQFVQSVDEKLIDFSPDALPHRTVITAWNMQRFSTAQIARLHEKLEQLVKEVWEQEPEPNAEAYHDLRLFFTLFPVRAYLDVPKDHAE